MDLQQCLENTGLTKNEAKVYLSLLDIGTTTTSPIIKKTAVNTSKVYESLERLLKKGLVSYTIIKNRKHWTAESPDQIKDYLGEEKKKIEQKENQILKAIPELNFIRETRKQKSQYSVFEGVRGIKTAREKVFQKLKKGDTFYIMLSTYPKQETLEAYWFDFQKRRAKKGIKVKYILNENIRKLGEKRKKLPLTQTRYAKPETLSPTWIEIFGDCVGIGVFGQNPSIFLIESEDVAQGFLNQFNSLWKTAKP